MDRARTQKWWIKRFGFKSFAAKVVNKVKSLRRPTKEERKKGPRPWGR